MGVAAIHFELGENGKEVRSGGGGFRWLRADRSLASSGKLLV